MWRRRSRCILCYPTGQKKHRLTDTDRGKTGLKNWNFLLIGMTFLIQKRCWLFIADPVLCRTFCHAFNASTIWLCRLCSSYLCSPSTLNPVALTHFCNAYSPVHIDDPGPSTFPAACIASTVVYLVTVTNSKCPHVHPPTFS